MCYNIAATMEMGAFATIQIEKPLPCMGGGFFLQSRGSAQAAERSERRKQSAAAEQGRGGQGAPKGTRAAPTGRSEGARADAAAEGRGRRQGAAERRSRAARAAGERVGVAFLLLLDRRTLFHHRAPRL